MPITTIDVDHDALTLTIVAEFAAPKQRLWDAYADPRLIEQFWAPKPIPRASSVTTCIPAARAAM